MGVSAPSLHIESTDSMIVLNQVRAFLHSMLLVTHQQLGFNRSKWEGQ